MTEHAEPRVTNGEDELTHPPNPREEIDHTAHGELGLSPTDEANFRRSSAGKSVRQRKQTPIRATGGPPHARDIGASEGPITARQLSSSSSRMPKTVRWTIEIEKTGSGGTLVSAFPGSAVALPLPTKTSPVAVETKVESGVDQQAL